MREDNLILYAWQKLAAAVIHRALEDAYGNKKNIYTNEKTKLNANRFLHSEWGHNLATLCRYENTLKRAINESENQK